MDIYIKLPSDIQYYIICKLNETFKPVVLNDIKKHRKKFIIKCIEKYSPDFKYNTKNTIIYDWFNVQHIETRPWRAIVPTQKYLYFLKKIFPDITVTNNFFDVYYHYKKKYVGNFCQFIELLLNNLNVEDLEDLYNYMRFYVKQKSNTSPLQMLNVLDGNLFVSLFEEY